MNLQKIKTVVGELTIQEYLLRNNVDKVIVDELIKHLEFVTELKMQYDKLDLKYDLLPCQECGFPQFFHKKWSELNQ